MLHLRTPTRKWQHFKVFLLIPRSTMACSSCNPKLMPGLKPSAASGASFWVNLTRLRPGAVSPQGLRGGPGPTSTCPGGRGGSRKAPPASPGVCKKHRFHTVSPKPLLHLAPEGKEGWLPAPRQGEAVAHFARGRGGLATLLSRRARRC